MCTLVLTLISIALIALALAQFASSGFASGRTTLSLRKRRVSDLKHLRQVTEIARLNSNLKTSTSGSVVPWRVMEVAEIVEESRDCRSFYLTDPYRQALPLFRPGQHLMVRPALAGAYQTTRCYSLSSSPDPRYWRITVKLQEGGEAERRRSQEGGLSAWLHTSIGVGDCLLIGGPNGHFCLAEDNHHPLVLLAAGVGITPMASMLRYSMEHTPARPVTLLYQAKDALHWPLGEVLHTWTKKFPNCRAQSYFSRETPASLGPLKSRLAGQFEAGKFDSQQAFQAQAGQACDFFLCGPNAWMESLRSGLMEAGVESERIHWESFGAAGSQRAAKPEGMENALAVRFELSDVESQWSDPEQTLWELAREHQVEIPSGCLSGVCGCCRVKLISGEVEYDRPVSVELASDECLACVARPKTACCIDA